MAEYVHPEVLVSTDWVAQHRNDPNVRIVESDEDILLYDVGHIPGAVKVDWQSELQHQVIRDYVDQEAFGRLVGSKGVSNDHTVVFYGDRNNWWACYAFWVFNLGVQDVWPPRLPHYEWRTPEVDRRWAGDHAGAPHLSCCHLYGEQP